MKERPILFKAEMVRAILEGRKTQTRRIVKPQPRCPKAKIEPCSDVGWWFVIPGYMNDHDTPNGIRLQWKCPYGEVWDRLWVRETWADVRGKDFDNDLFPVGVSYKAECDADSLRIAKEYGVKWKPSIHMPRWASRITLEITGVRVERVQDITEEDAIDEGMTWAPGEQERNVRKWGVQQTARAKYADLWESINGAGSWDANLWVWVIEFKRIR